MGGRGAVERLTEALPGRAAGGEADGQQGRGGPGGRPLAAVFLVVLVNVIGFGIVIPLLPFYAQSFGASAFTVGLLFAAFAAAQLVAVPFLGYLSDRVGRRPILLLSLVGSVVAFVLLGLAQSLALVFVSRIVDGATGGNITTARAVIADVTPEEDRARGFGVLGAAFGLGLILGPALGGLLAGIDVRLPAWVAAAMALGAAALTWVWLPETVPPDAEPRDLPWTEARRLVARPDVARFLKTDLAYWCAFGAFQTAFPLFLADRLGYGATGTGLTMGFVGVVNTVTQLRLIGPISDRIGDRNTLAAGMAVGGAGVAGLALAPNLALILLALAPAAFGIALANPSLASLLSRSVGREEQGRLQGVSGALESLGRGVGPVWGNGLIGLAGGGVAYATVAAALLGLAAWSRTLPEPGQEAGGGGR